MSEELVRRISNSIDNYHQTVEANPENKEFAKKRLNLVVEEHVKEAIGE